MIFKNLIVNNLQRNLLSLTIMIAAIINNDYQLYFILALFSLLKPGLNYIKSVEGFGCKRVLGV